MEYYSKCAVCKVQDVKVTGSSSEKVVCRSCKESQAFFAKPRSAAELHLGKIKQPHRSKDKDKQLKWLLSQKPKTRTPEESKRLLESADKRIAANTCDECGSFNYKKIYKLNEEKLCHTCWSKKKSKQYQETQDRIDKLPPEKVDSKTTRVINRNLRDDLY